MAVRGTVTKLQAPAKSGHNTNDYVVPLVHIRLTEPVVKAGFYGGLATAVAVGVVDLPLALLVGIGVAIARHQRS
jgi:hypothetical protein